MTTKEALQGAGIDALDAEVLLAHVLGRSRTWLLAHSEESLSEAPRKRFDALARRRRAGEPVAYLTGTKEFYGRDFRVSSDVLCPRPETEDLVTRVVSVARPGDTVFDIGTGSGCIGITIALERPELSVVLTDISEQALAVAKRNARALQADVGFALADGLPETAADIEPERLVIVSNPPYLETSDTPPPFEPSVAFAGGADGLDVIRSLIEQLKQRELLPRHLMFEHRKSHGAAIRALLGPKARTFQDLAGHDRITGY